MPAQQPLTNSNFRVEWGGSNIGFLEVSGLNIDIEPITYRQGSSPVDSRIKIPGLRKYENIVLKRGVMKGDNDFFNWINTKQMDKIERRDITIALLNENHEPVVIWRARNAFPVKYTGPTLNAKSNEVAIETLELTHEGLDVVMV